MKKFLLTTCVAYIAITGKVTAQKTAGSMITDNMKCMQINGGYPNNIHIRAVRDFVKRYKSAIDAQWAVVDNGYVQCYEAQMPRDVRALVKSRYFDYAITLVEEIERPSKPLVYLVHLQDATTLVNVQVNDGEMEVVADYIKG